MTFRLITKLLEKSESRGVDAAGFWGAEAGDGKIVYHKEPGKASSLVKKDVWREVQSYDLDLMLVHARAASKGVGEPAFNENNHPFASSDKTIGLVHNGRIEDYEYHPLAQKYAVQSECDSEILLRIIEAADSYREDELADFANLPDARRLAGVRDIFSFVNDGHMAVAFGERRAGDRLLWLFRNRHRPLWVVDLRDALGQIYFVSEPKVWDEAVWDCKDAANVVRSQKMMEVPPEQTWAFKKDRELMVQRFQVTRDRLTPWAFDGKRVEVNHRPAPCQVVSRIDEVVAREDATKTIEKKIRRLNGIASNVASAIRHNPDKASMIIGNIDAAISILEAAHSTIGQ